MGLFNDKVKLKSPNYNWFDLSRTNKLTFDIGRMTPVLLEHCFAGDCIKISKQHLIRFSPMLAPVMQRFDIRFDTFVYPEHIVYKRAYDFYRGGSNGDTDFVLPSVPLWCLYVGALDVDNVRGTGSPSSTSFNPLLHSLVDYFGFPTFDKEFSDFVAKTPSEDVTSTNFLRYLQKLATDVDLDTDFSKPVNIIPFLMYQGLYREYYRDEFVDLNHPNIENSTSDILPNQVRYFESYFPDIDAEVVSRYISAILTQIGNGNFGQYIVAAAGDNKQEQACNDLFMIMNAILCVRDVRFQQDYFTSAQPTPQLVSSVNIPFDLCDDGGSSVSVSAGSVVNTRSNRPVTGSLVNSSTIPDLRKANKLQEYRERSLIGGNRPLEWFLNIFGVRPSDERLQRPAFIHRSKSYVSISEVTQTSATEFDNNSNPSQALGSFGGHALSADSDFLIDYSFTEPSFVFVIMSLVPKQAYFQGINKELTKTDRFDFLIPQFAEIGAQPIYASELHYDKDKEEIFGYTDRYMEYKTRCDEIHGDFKDTLQYWHDSRRLPPSVKLNSSFIGVQGDLNKIFAYEANDFAHIYCLIDFQVKCLRALPEYVNYRL